MKIKKSYILIILISIFINFPLRTTANELNPVILIDSSDKYCIGKSIEFIEDIKGKLTFDKILKDKESKEQKLKWTRSENELPSFGFTTSVYWFRFSITDFNREK